MTSVQLTYKELRSIKPYIRSLIPGSELNRPEIIEIEFIEHPNVVDLFKGSVYDGGSSDSVVGYVELTPDTVGDMMRLLSKKSESFVLINAEAEFKKNGWKYIKHANTVKISEEIPGLVLREHAEGYVLTYGITENRHREGIAELQDRYNEIVQEWSMWCTGANRIIFKGEFVGLVMENGIKIRFDYPDMFAVVTDVNGDVQHFSMQEEFFFYIGKTYF